MDVDVVLEGSGDIDTVGGVAVDSGAKRRHFLIFNLFLYFKMLSDFISHFLQYLQFCSLSFEYMGIK